MFMKTFQVRKQFSKNKEDNMKITHTRRCWYVFVISIVMLSWLCAGDAFSQSSGNYRIERSVLDAGDGDRNSANYALCDSLGQVSGTAISTSSSYRHIPGFYECSITGGSPPPPTPTSTNPIPEPGTLILFGSVVVGLFMLVRRTLNKKKAIRK
jgi:hypothetical protein